MRGARGEGGEVDRRSARRVRLFTLSAAARRGVITCGRLRFCCAIGRGGIRASKREGDGATPRGRYVLEQVLYRVHHAGGPSRPRTCLPVSPIGRFDGWCDAVGDRNYNRRVRHPYPASAERLWRDDGLYDVVVVLSHNRRARVQGHGSAIFIHIARPGFPPTEGCIALSRRDLRVLLAHLPQRCTIDMTRFERPRRAA